METIEVKIAEFIESLGLIMECSYIGTKTEQYKDQYGKPTEHVMDSWSCVLSRGSQTMTIPFHQGLAHRKMDEESYAKSIYGSAYLRTRIAERQAEVAKRKADIERNKDRYKWAREDYDIYWKPVAPELDTVLDCLRSDAESWENARNFEDFCAEFGYDTDSRKAEGIYRACGEVAKELKFLLGSANYKKLTEEVERL